MAVAERCQCPNPWIEFLAASASDRRSRSLSKLSIQQHAKIYRKSRRDGAYRSRHSSPSICNGNDTAELCTMLDARKHKFNWQKPNFDIEFLALRSKLLRKLYKRDIFSATYKQTEFIVKSNFGIGDKLSRYSFLYQTMVHLECRRRLHDLVPRLVKAYFLKSPGNSRGVHIMERVPGITLDTFMQDNKKSPLQLRKAAEKVFSVLKALTRARIWHGDLHGSNIMLKLGPDGVEKAYIIDFGDVVVDVDVGLANYYRFLSIEDEDSQPAYKLLLPYLRPLMPFSLPEDDRIIALEDSIPAHLWNLHDKIVAKIKNDPIDLPVITDSMK
jgi:hypothetical protein